MAKIRIKLKGFDSKVVDSAMGQIVQSAVRTGAKIVGPVLLPTRIKRWTVQRSPHVDARSKETFEMKTHKRILDIVDPTAKTVEALTRLQLPAGVELEIKQ